MKLLGVEFENFACFNKRFIPLQPGLNVLVGKNNSGKTAVLRGLSVLTGLPVGESSPISNDLAAYTRVGDGHPSFVLRIRYQVEVGDQQLLEGPENLWEGIVRTRRPEFVFSFRAWPTQATVTLEECQLLLGEKKLRVMERTKEDAKWIWYDEQGGAKEARQMDLVRQLPSPDEKSHWVVKAVGVFRELVPLMQVRLIDAHRVTRAGLALQSVTVLPSNCDTLPQFLQTLHGSERRKFEAIETVVTRVFPELQYVNPESADNKVSITLTLRENQAKVRLTHCGTGVEQVLALATFVLASPEGSTILLDEPHSYLHPSAERELIRFLQEHSEHTYVIGTHSAVLINSVEPDRIIHLGAKQEGRERTQSQAEVSSVLGSLGYSNSDFLFNDRLIFVEGESDQLILPKLLRCGGVAAGDVERTGFPPMGGKGDANARKRQTPLLRYENMLQALGRAELRRIYLFDGDCDGEARTLLTGTRSPATGRELNVRFLPRREIENYLLAPEAIAPALGEQTRISGGGGTGAIAEDVKERMEALLKSEDGKIFPGGKGEGDAFVEAKGSVVLERLFEQYELAYDKKTSGCLIASHLGPESVAALAELRAVVDDLFP